MTVEIYRSSAWQDISDYVSKASPVPYIGMNRDWTSINEHFDCSISFGCPYIPVLSDKIKVTVYNTIIFSGFITRTPSNADSRTYDIEVSHNLLLLQNLLVEHSSGITACAIVDGYGYRLFYILPLLKEMFTLSGLILDTTAVENILVFHDATLGIDVYYRSFYTWEPALYCINQSIAANYTVIDDTLLNKYNGSKITFYDYFNEIISGFGFGIQITDINTFKLIAPTSGYTPSDDTKYSYVSDPITAASKDAVATYNVAGVNYSDYTNTTPYARSAPVNVSGLGTLALSWYSNNLILWNDDPTNTIPYSTGGGLYPFATNSASVGMNVTKNKFNANCANYTEERITTDIDLTPRTVIQNYIDLEKRTSIIIQETY